MALPVLPGLLTETANSLSLGTRSPSWCCSSPPTVHVIPTAFRAQLHAVEQVEQLQARWMVLLQSEREEMSRLRLALAQVNLR